ncbi:MAG: helix-turn-helix domain-containing protein [Pseudonocardiaceae bacterium]
MIRDNPRQAAVTGGGPLTNQQDLDEARRALGHLLAERRRAAGYTQHQFAPRTHYARSTIANVEVGRQHVPRAFWECCDHVLGTDRLLSHAYDDLQLLVDQYQKRTTGKLGRSQPGQYQHEEVPCDPMRRRTLVTWGVATTAITGLGIASVGQVGVADVERLQRTAARLHRLDQQHGGESLWQSAAAAADEGYFLLERGSYSSAVGERLLMATSRLQICAGWLAFDAGKHDVTRICYTDALALARQAGDPEGEVRALANMAIQSNETGWPREAQRLSVAAEQVAASVKDSPRLSVVPQFRQAIASSLMADAREADRAIARARRALDRERDEPAQEWCAFITPFEIDGIEATCALELGQAARAEALLEKVIAGYDPRFVRNRAVYRVRLARARLDGGAVDGAAEAANLALDDLSGELASWMVSSELNEVARRLADHPEVPGVDRFASRHTAMSAA